ncbi:MAG TPA: phage tail protein [Terracidiphilus sp.]|jgi:phage tail-like protein
MDANQTRFQLVFGKNDWFGPESGSPPADAGLEWRASDSTVALRQSVFVFPPVPGTAALTAADRRGAAQDQYGNYYWVSPAQDELLFLGAGQQSAQHFWSAKDQVSSSTQNGFGVFSPLAAEPVPQVLFGGLAVTADHYLLVGTLEPAGLLLFDLYTGGAPMQFRWPANVAFAPFDIAASADGGAWILDWENRRYWGIDPHFHVLEPLSNPAEAHRPPDFQPVGGTANKRPSCEPQDHVSDGQAMPIAALSPIGIAALPDGSVLILDSLPTPGYSQIYRYRLTNLLSGPIALNQVDVGQAAPYALLGQDLAFVPAAGQANSGAAVRGTLYIADSLGLQTFSFNYDSNDPTWAIEPNPQFFPMLRFGGKALVTNAAGVSYDFDQRWASLVAQPRARFDQQVTWTLPRRDATFETDPDSCAFDGREPGCVWHRLLMDGTIPSGTQVLVESRAADSKSALRAMDWNPEPQPYLRFTGPELPYYRPALGCCSNKTGTWELLFQSAVGRYLQIQLTLVGNGRSTPRLQTLRAYYPRFSYLKKYLPAVYQNDATSASFLDRYLANPEGFFTVLEGRIQQVQELFDPRTVPAEYLDWLASWMGITFDFTWSTETRRFFLANAPRFFQSRGTSDGVVRMIRMALDQCADASLFDPADLQHFSVRIVENYLLRNAPGVTFGDPTDVQTPGTVSSDADWTPAQGAAPLDQSYRSYLSGVYVSISALNAAYGTGYSGFDDPGLRLPAIQPAQTAQASDWLAFLSSGLGFTYAAVTSADEPAYENFLISRYGQVSALNLAYQLTGVAALPSFADIQVNLWAATLAAGLPTGGAFLADWILFVSVVIPTSQNANRFTVVVPVQLTDSLTTQNQRRSLAQRIAQNEKPAHTDFDVKLYWAAFCAGEARVGMETVVGPSSRFAAVVLDQNELAAAYLGFELPWTVRGRLVTGRDQLRNGNWSGGAVL